MGKCWTFANCSKTICGRDRDFEARDRTRSDVGTRALQLLGEAYLQARQGTLAVQALNDAIRLDPIGMAECHLQLAHLYELAGARQLAAKEYKTFLSKVPDHPDQKKLEKFIKDNP